MIWFVSDWHFNHNKEFIWKDRGYKSVEHMNADLISKHNKLVAPNDIVYVLGDCTLGDTKEGIPMLKLLNGKKYLAYGNHDTDNRIQAYKDNNIFEEINMGYRVRYGKYTLVASHYPQLVANGSEYSKIYSVHGHTHSQSAFSDVFHAYNVNIDAHDGGPVSIEQIIQDIKEHKNEL